MRKPISRLIKWLMPAILAISGMAASATDSEQKQGVWEQFLKEKYFPDVEIIEDKTVIDLKTPYRAEDAAVTPVSIVAQIPQKEDLYIKKISLIVDENPQPLAGVFNLTTEMGKADLAMRIRVDKYTNVRAIAELSNGEHHMVTNFVKAQGGCSAPLGADLKAAMDRMGSMKFRALAVEEDEQLELGQFMISHPNITGMQLDQRTRLITPAHYVKKLVLSYDDQLIMDAEVGISISADPSFRFFFKPDKSGVLKADVSDSKGMEWTETFEVKI